MDWFGEMESDEDDQMTELIADALSSNDKVIEIRPVDQSKGMGLKGLLLFGVAAVGLAYWVQNSRKPNDLIEDVKEKTAGQTDQAAETIEEGTETVSERIESGSEQAGEAVQEIGEEAADRTEEVGEKAADEADDDTSSSSGT